jgi:hypothetical protein
MRYVTAKTWLNKCRTKSHDAGAHASGANSKRRKRDRVFPGRRIIAFDACKSCSGPNCPLPSETYFSTMPGPRAGSCRAGTSKQPIALSADSVYASGKRLAGSLLLGLMGTTACCAMSATPLASQRARGSLSAGVLKPCASRGDLQAVRLAAPACGSTERSGESEPLAPKLEVEVQYDHLSGGRFRHGTKLLRWRPDKGQSNA